MESRSITYTLDGLTIDSITSYTYSDNEITCTRTLRRNGIDSSLNTIKAILTGGKISYEAEYNSFGDTVKRYHYTYDNNEQMVSQIITYSATVRQDTNSFEWTDGNLVCYKKNGSCYYTYKYNPDFRPDTNLVNMLLPAVPRFGHGPPNMYGKTSLNLPEYIGNGLHYYTYTYVNRNRIFPTEMNVTENKGGNIHFYPVKYKAAYIFR